GPDGVDGALGGGDDGREGVGRAGAAGTPGPAGRGAAGNTFTLEAAGPEMDGPAILAAGGAAGPGRGWRGPDKICPGRGAGGSGLAGIAVPGRATCFSRATGVCADFSRVMVGVKGSRRALGCPANGGRMGAGFGRAG